MVIILIDEAGQGIPQAAVGALQRVKRAVVVGDPLQIKPVVTLDPAIVEGLRQYFGVDECWSPYKSSIQSLSDRINPYGTTIETNTEPLWIGCPLWVHRRCTDPMFTIANEIAYNNKMVIATKPPSQNQYFSLGESRWIDVDGNCRGQQWVPEQGEEIVKLLKQLIDREQLLPSLYIISPFRAVAAELKNLLRQKKDQWAKEINPSNLKNWIIESVGTVHTFQGKETDSVILLLGTDKNSQEAAKWAADEPNILNVATTRAKYRFYIVGSKSLWSERKYFKIAYESLNNK